MISGRRQVQVMVLVTVAAMMTVLSIAWAASDLDTLKTTLQALERTAAGAAEEEQLLKDIGALAQQLKAMPLPKEARRYMARGEAYVEGAKDKEDFKLAAQEFEAAAKAAPWLASAYYNLGIVQDKAGLYSQAMRSLKIYLAIAPDAPDAAAVEKLIFKIEVRKEQTKKTKAKQAEQVRGKEMLARQADMLVENLSAEWTRREYPSIFTDSTGKQQTCYHEAHYRLMVKGPRAFRMEYMNWVNYVLESNRRIPEPSGGMYVYWYERLIDATVDDSLNLRGTVTTWEKGHPRQTYEMTGRINKQGNEIVINYNTHRGEKVILFNSYR